MEPTGAYQSEAVFGLVLIAAMIQFGLNTRRTSLAERIVITLMRGTQPTRTHSESAKSL